MFLIGAATVSVPVWTLGFELGCYRTIFFEHSFALAAVSLAVFVASFLVPRAHSPVGWIGRGVLVLPWVWLVVTALSDPTVPLYERSNAHLMIGLGIIVLSLPWIFATIVRILDADLLGALSARSIAALVGVSLLIAAISFLVGVNHGLFLSSYDFEVSGNMVPRW